VVFAVSFASILLANVARVPNRERKSSGSETTFSEDFFAPADIEAGITAMADDV